MMAVKAFIKPFEAPERSVKINIYVNLFFFLRDRDGVILHIVLSTLSVPLVKKGQEQIQQENKVDQQKRA